MAVDQIKVDIDDLTTGMYVSRLDRPWIETPFPLQGYYIKHSSDITSLRQYCKYVYIDIRRGKSPVDAVFLQTLESSVSTSPKAARQAIKGVRAKKLKTRKGAYKYATSPKKEVKNAKKMKEMAELTMAYIEQAVRSHSELPIDETRQVASKMVDNIIKNPDAFIWLTKIRDKDSHLYGHAVRVTIWSISLGRHLGLSVRALNQLAMGAMLSEVGKLVIEEHLLQKDVFDMSINEFEQYQKHVHYALEVLKDLSLIHI